MTSYISIAILFFLSLSAAGAEQNINIRIGNREFRNIDRQLLLKYPSRLQTKFSDEGIKKYQSDKTSDGYYIIDGDPDLFDTVLGVMRNGRLKLKSTTQDAQQRERYDLFEEADQYVFTAMLEALAWDIYHATTDLNKLPTRIWQNMPALELRASSLLAACGKKKHFMVCDQPNVHDPYIIGSNKHGHAYKENIDRPIKSRFNNIVIAWNGFAYLPYNVVTNEAIGESAKIADTTFTLHPFLTHVIDGRYLCSRLSDESFAIFDAVTAKRLKARANTNYKNLDACVDDLYALFERSRVGED